MLGYYIGLSVVGIMLSIGGIVLGFGYAFDDKKLKSFGRDEIINSVINGAILASLFLFFSQNGLGVSIINGLVSGSGAEATCQGFMSINYAVCFAYNYLVGVSPISINGNSYPSLLEDSLGMLLPISSTYIILGIIASTKLSIGIASVSFSSVLAPVLAQEDFIITSITLAIIGIYVQSALLDIISIVAIPLLLPVGIVLRTFYPTRRLGGTIIAIAIGLFAVFPLTYLLDAQVAASYSSAAGSSSISQFSTQANGVEGSIIGVSEAANSTKGTILGYLTGGVSQLASSFESIVNRILDTLAILIIEVFFFPTFSVILTITSIRELSRVLGSEVSFGRFDVF